jgi:hypothetical protein
MIYEAIFLSTAVLVLLALVALVALIDRRSDRG